MAKPQRLALGACIIQAEYGYSNDEITLQIQENLYLQYFCSYAGYDDSKLPFDSSLMVYFRKRARKDYLKYARSRKHTAQKTRAAIRKQKTGKPVEFGAKLDISVAGGWTRPEYCSFDAYNEAGNLQEITERFRIREGYYPKRILAGKIYRNRDNPAYCKKHHIRLSGPALGRPKKNGIPDKKQTHLDECERVEVERCFSMAKRKCGIGLVATKLQETAAHVIAMSILVLNLRRIQRALLQLWALLTSLVIPRRNLVVIQ